MTASESSTEKSPTFSKDEPLVCRRVLRAGVVVASLHPIIGPVYWDYIDNSDCNAADSYHFTNNVSNAMIFRSQHYRGHTFSSFQWGVIGSCYEDADWDDDNTAPPASWQLKELSQKAGCTEHEFQTWMEKTVWVEYPAPVTIAYLSDFNGFLGYRPEWTRDLHEALQWPQSTVHGDDLDAELARTVGELVPLSVADKVSTGDRKISNTNHALESDLALTRHRLRLVDLKQPSQLDNQEQAWVHAARAGVEYVLNGDRGPISEHIAPFPDLLSRFAMGASLARYEANQMKQEHNSPFDASAEQISSHEENSCLN